MSREDTRQRTNCAVCGQRYKGHGIGLLTHEKRSGHGAWVWHYRFLCPPCRSAHIDLVLDGVADRRQRSPINAREAVPRDPQRQAAPTGSKQLYVDQLA